MAEQLPLKQLVGGSSPPGRTTTNFVGIDCSARRAQNIFSIKESIFTGFAFLLTQRRAASHPCRAFGAEQAGKNSFPPAPPFLFAHLLFDTDFF